MFIAKNNDLIILAKNTREELEQALQFAVYTSIEETEVKYELYNGSYLTKDEIQTKEQERIAMLFMTGSDVERAIYKVKGIDFDDILAMLKDNSTIDVKALKIEFKANNFYRGNPYISQVGAFLGFTSEQMDKFFETKDYHELITKEVENENTTDTEQPTDVSDEMVPKTTDEPDVN